MNKNDVLTDPKKLVTMELKNAGFDIENMRVPKRVYLLADSLYDMMLSKNVGIYKYPLGGANFMFSMRMKMLDLSRDICVRLPLLHRQKI